MAIKVAISVLCLLSAFIIGPSVVEGAGLYDYNTQRCCMGKVIDLTPDQANSYYTSCCGNQLYDYNIQYCCGTSVYDSVPGYQCCGDQYMQLTSSQICCDDNVVDVDGDAYDYICCGGMAYDNTNYMYTCCDGELVENIDEDGNYVSCCGSKGYSYETQVCCYDTGVVIDKPRSGNCPESTYYSCCNDRLLGPDQQCCNDVVVNPSSIVVTDEYGSYTQMSYCCGMGIVQNYEKETCCSDGNVIPGGDSIDCCGSFKYNYTTQTCCGSKLYNSFDYSIGCCGDNVMDYNSQICCNDEVLDNPNQLLSCCYDYDY